MPIDSFLICFHFRGVKDELLTYPRCITTGWIFQREVCEHCMRILGECQLIDHRIRVKKCIFYNGGALPHEFVLAMRQYFCNEIDEVYNRNFTLFDGFLF